MGLCADQQLLVDARAIVQHAAACMPLGAGLGICHLAVKIFWSGKVCVNDERGPFCCSSAAVVHRAHTHTHTYTHTHIHIHGLACHVIGVRE